MPDHGIVDVDLVARTLVRVLGDRFDGLAFEPARRLIPLTIVEGEERRKPFFCSGCPHGRSTQVPDGAVGGAGIGCHVLSPDWTVMSTQMGGEGVAWVGAHAFMVDPPHLFQNVGDGTFAHSASLAVRQAVGFGTPMTFKILLNGTVAMTGGQAVAGGMDAPKLTRVLQAEGVSRIIVCADDPDKYGSDALWAPGTTVWGRARIDEAEHELMATEGVSILIFDQACATELRRQRKRGEVAVPKERVFINERVCEGCGDCVSVSYCLSLQPVETEFGRKTRIHQESCNIDRSCIEGDCPSFVTITPGTPRPIDEPDESRGPLPDPIIPERADLLFVGIGGTGVTTVSQVLGTAALLDGKASVGLDQTGMSQKAGPVVSHVRIGPADSVSGNRLGEGEADAVLAFDVLGAVTPGQPRPHVARSHDGDRVGDEDADRGDDPRPRPGLPRRRPARRADRGADRRPCGDRRRGRDARRVRHGRGDEHGHARYGVPGRRDPVVGERDRRGDRSQRCRRRHEPRRVRARPLAVPRRRAAQPLHHAVASPPGRRAVAPADQARARRCAR